MKIKLNNILMIMVLGTSAMTLQGCSDTDVALGAGVVIGAIISNGGHHHHHHDRGYRGRHRGHRRFSVDLDMNQTVTPVQQVAENYQISEETADKILTSLEQVNAGDLSAIQAIGLQKEDLISLMKGNEISDSALLQVGLELEMSTEEAESLLRDIQMDVKEIVRKNSNPSYIPGH